MRMTQEIGMNKRAKAFLEENASKDHMVVLRNGKVDREYDSLRMCKGRYSTTGMYEEYIPLIGYELKDGTKVYEKLQICYWSSGPMLYTALVDEMDKWVEETKWTMEDAKRETGEDWAEVEGE